MHAAIDGRLDGEDPTIAPTARRTSMRTILSRTSALVLLPLPMLLLVLTAASLISHVQRVGARQFILAQDFRAQYTAGRMVLQGAGAQFHDLQAQFTAQRAWAPELDQQERLMPFLSPPFAALPLAVVAALPVESAYLAWLGINLAIGAAALAVLAPAYRSRAPSVAAVGIGALAFPPVFMTLVQGQLSLILVLVFVLAWRSLRSGNELGAGAWLALLAIKPYLAIMPLLTLIVGRQWRAVAGMIAGGAGLLVVTLLMVGTEGVVNYLSLAQAAATWGDAYTVHPRQMHTIRGALHSLLGTDQTGPVLVPWMLISGALIAVTLGAMRWWMAPRSDARLATAMIVGLLVSPHGNLHDLSLLAPALLLAWAPFSGGSARSLAWLIGAASAFVYLAPWLALTTVPLFGITPTVLAMAGLAIALTCGSAVASRPALSRRPSP